MALVELEGLKDSIVGIPGQFGLSVEQVWIEARSNTHHSSSSWSLSTTDNAHE